LRTLLEAGARQSSKITCREHNLVRSRILLAQKIFEQHDEYKIPFVVSRYGKIVGHYFLANWTGGLGPDLIYDSEGNRGFRRNGGPGVGWQPETDDRFVPPISLDARSHVIDFNCNGRNPMLVGVAPDSSSGQLGWHVYRLVAEGWKEEYDENFKPKIPPTTNPEAIREIAFGKSSSSCKGLLVATAEGAGVHKALAPAPGGWSELVTRRRLLTSSVPMVTPLTPLLRI
jgi:hypothetical protein